MNARVGGWILAAGFQVVMVSNKEIKRFGQISKGSFFASAVVYFTSGISSNPAQDPSEYTTADAKNDAFDISIKSLNFLAGNLHNPRRIRRFGHKTHSGFVRFALCAQTFVFLEDYEGSQQGNYEIC